ncbi:hypothetical protein F8S13_20250 [Chloroflexia bacterium SDU3-3]|nr:hypothetical protein F8S13_20250 [Chloroflexia bacterium SDU3-3]
MLNRSVRILLAGVPLGFSLLFAAEHTYSQQKAQFTSYLPLIALPRTAAIVNPHSREDSRMFFHQIYRSTEGIASGWTGSIDGCVAGELAPRYRQSLQDRVNYFRAMAGVPATIRFDSETSAQAQAAALMMSANGALSHAPPSTWRCYSAAGAEGAGRSNLFLGVHGPDAITGFMQDVGHSNDIVAHRRWILYPQTQQMGLGDVPATGAHQDAQALLVLDAHTWDARPATRDDFVAWPPAGYVPYPVVFARWSFAYPGADFSAATVGMRRDQAAIAVQQAAPRSGYGENTLVWMPVGMESGDAWPQPTADTVYTITIEHVLIDGMSRDFTYTVTVFDPA